MAFYGFLISKDQRAVTNKPVNCVLLIIIRKTLTNLNFFSSFLGLVYVWAMHLRGPATVNSDKRHGPKSSDSA